MIIQFQGESRTEAIINNFSLDIEEQDEFFSYIEEMGYSIDDEDELLESLYKMFNNKKTA